MVLDSQETQALENAIFYHRIVNGSLTDGPKVISIREIPLTIGPGAHEAGADRAQLQRLSAIRSSPIRPRCLSATVAKLTLTLTATRTRPEPLPTGNADR